MDNDKPAGRLLAEITLDNGEVVHAALLSPYAMQAIAQKSKEVFPDPDPKQYERPLKGAPEGAPPEPLDMNPEWTPAVLAARKKQNDWFHWALAQAAIIDTAEGRAVTIARYADTVAALRKFGKIEVEDWEATVLYCLITTRADVDRIYQAVNQMPTPDGVASKVTFFRH